MDSVVQLLINSGYNDPKYTSPGSGNVSADLEYVCDYCSDRSQQTTNYGTSTFASTDEDSTDDWGGITTTEADNETSLVCEISEQIHDILYMRYVLIPAGVIIFLLSFFLQRRRLALNCCSGRPGLIFPLNMVDYHSHRFPYVAAFTLCTWNMIDMIFKNSPFTEDEMTPSRSIFPDPPWIVLPNTAPFFILLSCIQIGFMYYPVFAALSSHHIIGYIFGTLYTWMTAIIFALNGVFCPKGLRTEDVILNYFSVLPPVICVIYLVIFFPTKVIHELCWKRPMSKTHPYPNTLALSESQYVKALLLRHKYLQWSKEKPVPWYQRFLDSVYVPTRGFKYSTSILTAVSMGACFAFMACIGELHIFYILWDDYQTTTLRALKREIKKGVPPSDIKFQLVGIIMDIFRSPNSTCPPGWTRSVNWVDTFGACYYAGLALGYINVVICLFLTLRSYKKNLLMIYQGRQYDIPPATDFDPKTLLVGAAKFVGFQAAYAVWGYFIQGIVIFAVLVSCSGFYNLLCHEDRVWVIIVICEKLWILVAVLVAVLLVQFVMARFLFLLKDEQGERVLALDNRRLFFNFNYFAIFANAALGIISCIVRLMKSIIFGLYVLPRLDMSTLNRHHERFDASFMSFVGLLYLENVHRNPVMVAATALMVESIKNKGPALFTVTETKKKFPNETSSRYNVVRNRWALAYSLFNNPGLRLYRKRKFLPPENLDVIYSDHNFEGHPHPPFIY